MEALGSEVQSIISRLRWLWQSLLFLRVSRVTQIMQHIWNSFCSLDIQNTAKMFGLSYNLYVIG